MRETKSAAADVKPVEKAAIRPFRVDVPEQALTDLRRRIKATRFPERTPAPISQGVQLAFIQRSRGHWAIPTGARRGKMNSYPSSSPNRWVGHPLHSRSLET
jgi:hypothetical protein